MSDGALVKGRVYASRLWRDDAHIVAGSAFDALIALQNQTQQTVLKARVQLEVERR